MLCQNCGKNQANIRYTQIINGVKKEMALCESCAEEMGIDNVKINMPINFSNFLGDLFEGYNEAIPSFIKETHNQCTSCGELYNDFIDTGLLGCPECYEIFDDRLDSVLKNLQGHTRHIGRKPLNISKKMENIGQNNIANKNSQDNKENNELEKLKVDLNKAIKEERYEDAATIRDKIKKLENK
ncbi:MAG: UvrB/UvrC motif-containing protein [Clostridia bacterium]